MAGAALAVAVLWYVSHLQSEIARLQEAERAAPAVAAAPEPAAPERPAGGRTLSEAQRAVMVETLGGRGVSVPNPVWFATITNNPEATAFREAIAGVFEEAGWQVRGDTPVRFRMKPGVFLFAADEEPPDYVEVASAALEAGGIEVTGGYGYRQFYEEKKRDDPSWVGLEMAPEVTYLIVIGRAPPEDVES